MMLFIILVHEVKLSLFGYYIHTGKVLELCGVTSTEYWASLR